MVLTAAIDGLKGAMFGLTSKAGELVQLGDKFTKASAALGKDFGSTFSQFEGSMNSLRGTLDQRFGANILALEAGLQGNAKGVAKLINQQQLTNGNFRRTAQALANMESALGLSREETNNLATGLIDTGSRFEISTDKLVDAVAALSDTFPVQALAGMGDNVMGAVTQLQAELGPQLSKSLTPMMKMVLDPSQEAYDKLVRLGIGDMRERLMASKTEAEALKIIKEASVTASRSFKELADGPFYNIGIATENFGRSAIHFTTIADNLGKRQEKEASATDLYAKTINNLFKEIFVPFQKAFIKFHPIFVEVTEILRDVVDNLGKEFEAFVDALRTSGGFQSMVGNLKITIMEIGISITEGLESMMGIAKDGFSKAFGPGGFMDDFKIVISEIGLALHTIAHPLGGDEAGRQSIEDLAKGARERKKMVEMFEVYNSAFDRGTSTMSPEVAEARRRHLGKLFGSKYNYVMQGMAQFEGGQEYARGMMMGGGGGTPTDSEFLASLKLRKQEAEKQLKLLEAQAALAEGQLEATGKIEENTRTVAEEVEDRKSRTRSQFLDETAMMIGSTMEAMLFGGGSVATQMIVQAIEDQTEVMEFQNGTQATSNFADQGS